MSLLSSSKRKEMVVLTPPSPHDLCISSYVDLSISCKQDDPGDTPPTTRSSNMDPSSIVTAMMIPHEGYLSHVISFFDTSHGKDASWKAANLPMLFLPQRRI